MEQVIFTTNRYGLKREMTGNFPYSILNGNKCTISTFTFIIQVLAPAAIFKYNKLFNDRIMDN
jgi:hypothetical protein